MVVCYHAASNLDGDATAAGHGFRTLPNFFIGNGGVDLFFLISGFVIVWTTDNQWWRENAWSGFVKKRAARILPLYWTLTTGKLVALLSMPYLFRAAQPTGRDIVASYLLLPAWDASGQISLILTAGWTLCFEMAFYYVATGCLALRRRPVVLATPLLVILGLLGIVRTPQWGPLASLIDPLLLEFVAGMWIAELTWRGRMEGRLSAMLTLLLLGVAAWLASSLLPPQTAFAWRVLVWGVPAAMILCAVIALESHLELGKLRLPLLLGDASYSIYLGHVLILQPLIGMARHFTLPGFGEWLVFAGLVSLALSFGVLMWWGLERKLILGGLTMFNDRFKRV